MCRGNDHRRCAPQDMHDWLRQHLFLPAWQKEPMPWMAQQSRSHATAQSVITATHWDDATRNSVYRLSITLPGTDRVTQLWTDRVLIGTVALGHKTGPLAWAKVIGSWDKVRTGCQQVYITMEQTAEKRETRRSSHTSYTGLTSSATATTER